MAATPVQRTRPGDGVACGRQLAQMVQLVLFGAVAATIGMPLANAAGGMVRCLIAAAVHPRPR